MILTFLAGVILGAALVGLWPQPKPPVVARVRCPHKIPAPDQRSTVRVIR